MTTTTMTLTPDFDLVVRNAVVITASEEMRCDIGVRAGRIVALAETLGPGQREIDAAGRWVLPGGVDAHCHLDQPLPPPARMADGFESGTRSAARMVAGAIRSATTAQRSPSTITSGTSERLL